MSNWTDARRARAKDLWMQGRSAGEISEALGGCTRNAVISLVHRAGLKRDPATSHLNSNLAAKRLAPPPRPPRPAGPPVQVVEHASRSRAWAPLPGSTPVTLMSLGPCMCKWPVDLLAATEAHFCGRNAEDVYCATHEVLSAPPTGTKERLDERLGVAGKAKAA